MTEEIIEVLHILVDGISLATGERDRLHQIVESLKTVPPAPVASA